MIQDHNEKFYSYAHRDLLSEYARGQIELNRRSHVSGSDCLEVTDEELKAWGFEVYD